MSTDELTRDPRRTAAPWQNPPVDRHALDGDRYTSAEFLRAEWDGMWTKVADEATNIL